jgi:ketosteroid isomerase-like protein
MLLRSHLRSAAFLLALVAPALVSAVAQDPNPLHTASRQELDVIKVLLAQESAWNRGDLTAFASGYKDAPDTLFITHQVSRGFAGMLDEYKHDYPTRAAMGTLAFSELEVRPLDENFAVVLGKYHLDRGKKEGGPAEGIFTLVFEKTDKGWKIIIDHTT